MKRRYLFALLLGLLSLCLVFFRQVYDEAKQKAIADLNERQMIHARQAQRGIELFFSNITTLLNNLAASDAIIALTSDGLKAMDLVLATNLYGITAITRVDGSGKIAHTAPYRPELIGQDISGQRHMRQLLATRRPAVSDVFAAVQGYPAIAMHVPVFKDGAFNGTIGILIDFQTVSRRFLQDIRIGQTGYAWMISREGTELYCPVPGHTGNSVMENCKDFPTIIAMARQMMQGHRGETTYLFDRVGDERRETVRKHAVYMPIRIGDTFWSIVVASSEDEVLASLESLRDKLLLVIGVMLLGSGLFSYAIMKSWGIVREVERRQQAEAQLRENNALLDATGRIARVGGWQLDAKTLAVRWTSETYRLHEVGQDHQPSLEEAIAFFHPDDRPALAAAIQRALDHGEPYDMQLRFVSAKGNHLWTRTICQPLVVDGKTVGLIGVFQDVTAQKQAEQDKQVLEKQLQQAQRMESIGALAGGIAHDFNNLLFPIIGLAEMLMEDLDAGTAAHDQARDIFLAARRASDLVKQILAFSRQGDHEKRPVRIQTVVNEALKLARASIPSDIEVIVDVSGDCPPVPADPAQVHQIVMNLITNAFHAVEAGGGRIGLELKQATLTEDDVAGTTLLPGAFAALTVSDTGHGIDPAVMSKIFEPYFTTKPQGKGTGLGLSVVYGIVKDHGGDIRMSSRVGEGATFTVFLPLLIDAPPPTSSVQIHEVPKGSESVLLVDDEEPIARIEKQLLERLGYTVTVHTSSVDALATFTADPTAFDVVITDMTMPNMTGDRLARRILAIRPDMPIVICTGFSERLDEQRAKAIGINGFLMKPVVMGELAVMVRQVLGEKDNRSGDDNGP